MNISLRQIGKKHSPEWNAAIGRGNFGTLGYHAKRRAAERAAGEQQ
jgi:hypothetical protein